jgi:hypothetical protein
MCCLTQIGSAVSVVDIIGLSRLSVCDVYSPSGHYNRIARIKPMQRLLADASDGFRQSSPVRRLTRSSGECGVDFSEVQVGPMWQPSSQGIAGSGSKGSRTSATSDPRDFQIPGVSDSENLLVWGCPIKLNRPRRRVPCCERLEPRASIRPRRPRSPPGYFLRMCPQTVAQGRVGDAPTWRTSKPAGFILG